MPILNTLPVRAKALQCALEFYWTAIIGYIYLPTLVLLRAVRLVTPLHFGRAVKHIIANVVQ
ncbi:hypothetical protein, partial [Prevotellamassilia timonensis]|uniref:hypothetical protein n=1 Tax=Prevotellamassilia timonensis TaxID=1852370 RepID=UPI003FF07B02